MICEIKTSSITQIEYIPSSDIERVSNLWPAENKVSVLTLKAGKSWKTLAFLPETASFSGAGSNLGSHQYKYNLKCDLGGLDTQVIGLIKDLLSSRFAVKFKDTNKNEWLLGHHDHGGRWTHSRGEIGETLPDDNLNLVKFTYNDRIPLMKMP